MGPAARRVADRSAWAAWVHQRGGPALRARLGRPRLRHLSSHALHALLRRRDRRRIRVQRIDRLGAEVVQGATRAGVGHHRGRLWRRHGAVHPDYFVDDCVERLSSRVHLDRHLSGPRDCCRRAVPAPSANGNGDTDGSRRQASRRQAAIHDARDVAHAEVLRDVRDVRDDGDRRVAGHGQRRDRCRSRGG